MAMMPLITENNLPTMVTEAPASLVYNPVRPSVFTFGANYSDAFYAQLKYIHDHNLAKDGAWGIFPPGRRLRQGGRGRLRPRRERIRRQDRAAGSLQERHVELLRRNGADERGAASPCIANGGIFAGAANILAEARKLDMDIQSAGRLERRHSGFGALCSRRPATIIMVGDYVSLVGPANDKFKAMAKQLRQR